MRWQTAEVEILRSYEALQASERKAQAGRKNAALQAIRAQRDADRVYTARLAQKAQEEALQADVRAYAACLAPRTGVGATIQAALRAYNAKAQ